jgi:hypothetical protein
MTDRGLALGNSAIFADRVTETAPDFTASATSGTPVFSTLAARCAVRRDTCHVFAASGCGIVVALMARVNGSQVPRFEEGGDEVGLPAYEAADGVAECVTMRGRADPAAPEALKTRWARGGRRSRRNAPAGGSQSGT